ncbi:hypothetical protein FUAX_48720 (plasmid) [Fulvitalea axinellae]|uniref:Alpha/beta hydrolase n=1 Tax=Fulvitalea axinellae TaxID=1182444 RepID=A0AAU9CT64_9BACT|nr:hypothetical protein FUAX_48720 [Fulvitalea axinellae]
MINRRLKFLFFLVSLVVLGGSGCTSGDEKVQSELKAWLGKDTKSRSGLETLAFSKEALSAEGASKVKGILTKEAEREALETLGSQWDAREMKLGDKTMPFFYKVWGEKPADGRSLFISMHGGGGAPAKVNDQQYRNQQRLYDATMKGLEGVYLAPRAPGNSWDLWHRDEIEDFFNNIIRMAVIKEGVNPDKVYVMGYSAGGDGTFRMAPRMADRWAAASMMAGHPGGVSALNLRNLPFSIHMGELDAAYRRNELAAEWGEKLQALSDKYPGSYEHSVTIHKGKGHWMELQDAVALPWMLKFKRNPVPANVVWHSDNTRLNSMYWLEVPEKDLKKGGVVRASYDKSKNEINIEENYSDVLFINLNDAMLDLDKDVVVKYQGNEIFKGKAQRDAMNLWRSMSYKHDSKLAFPASLKVESNKKVTVRL